MTNDPEMARTVFQAVCSETVPADGMEFDPEGVAAEATRHQGDHEGVRVALRGRLGNTRVLIRVDIGFGGRVVPEPELLDYPTLLDFPAPRIRAYCRETAIAEKLDAMVQLGALNSRMKDFFDIWSLSRSLDFDGEALAGAVTEAFVGRGHAMPRQPLALTSDFARSHSKQVQWTAFLRKRGLEAPPDFCEVVARIAEFLGPVARAVAEGERFSGSWAAPGPWLPGAGDE